MDLSYTNNVVPDKDESSTIDFSKVVDRNVFNSLVATGILRGKDLAYFCSTNSKTKEWCDNQFYKEAYLRDFKRMPTAMPIFGEPNWREEYIQKYFPFYVSLSNEKERKLQIRQIDSGTLIAENMIPGPKRKGLSLFLSPDGRMYDNMEGKQWWEFGFENSKDFQCCTDPEFKYYTIAILDNNSKMWIANGSKRTMVKEDDINFVLYNPLGYIPIMKSDGSTTMHYKNFHLFYLKNDSQLIFTTKKNELYYHNKNLLTGQYVLSYTRPFIYEDSSIAKYYALTTQKKLILCTLKKDDANMIDFSSIEISSKVDVISNSFKGVILASIDGVIFLCYKDKMELIKELKTDFPISTIHLSENYMVLSGKEPFQYKVYIVAIKTNNLQSEGEMFKIKEDVTDYFIKADLAHIDGINMYQSNMFEDFKVRIN